MNKSRWVALARGFGIFVFGTLVGAIAYARLCDHFLPSYIDRSLRSMYKFAESTKATRAELEGDPLRAMVHQWNAAEASGVHWYRYSEMSMYCRDFFTLKMLMLNLVGAFPSNDAEFGEVLERGKLALLLEKNGFHDRAQQEWALTEKLTMFFDDVPDKASKTRGKAQFMHDSDLSLAKSDPELYFGALDEMNSQASGGHTHKHFQYPLRSDVPDQSAVEYHGVVLVESQEGMIHRNRKQIGIEIKDRNGNVALSDAMSFDSAAIYVQMVWQKFDALTLTIQLLDRGTARDANLYSEEDGPRMLATLKYRYDAEKKVFERVQ